MSGFRDIVFVSELTSDGFQDALRKYRDMLPPEMRRAFIMDALNYTADWQDEEAAKRLNGRTLGQLLDDFAAAKRSEELESGEREGIKYRLYPSAREKRESDPKDE